MHGAGLTHAVFLTPNSTLIELTTSLYAESLHFAAIARWRRLHYLRWIHRYASADFNAFQQGDVAGGDSYHIPPSVVTTLISNAVRRMCPSTAANQLGVHLNDPNEWNEVNLVQDTGNLYNNKMTIETHPVGKKTWERSQAQPQRVSVNNASRQVNIPVNIRQNDSKRTGHRPKNRPTSGHSIKKNRKRRSKRQRLDQVVKPSAVTTA